jgi:hypothetical protein
MSEPSPTTTTTRPRWALPVLIVFTLVCPCLVVPAAGMAMFSPMISDSGVNASIYLLIASFVLAPVVVCVSPLVAWIGFWRARLQLIIWAMLALPIFMLALAVQLLLWGAIG